MLPKYALEFFDIGSAQGQGNITQTNLTSLTIINKVRRERKRVSRKNKNRFCTRVSSQEKVLSA